MWTLSLHFAAIIVSIGFDILNFYLFSYLDKENYIELFHGLRTVGQNLHFKKKYGFPNLCVSLILICRIVFTTIVYASF